MIIWDNWNINHIARHHVTTEEVEEAMSDPDRVKVHTHGIGENKKRLIGKTDDRRFLFVVYVRQENGLYIISKRCDGS